MELSRKTKKNLKKLRGGAEELWIEQQKVLDQAGKVVADARKRLGEISDSELRPRVDSALAQVKPTVDRGVAYGQATASVVKDRVVSDVLPAVARAVGSAVSMVELAKDPRVRQALKNTRKAAGDVADRVGSQASKISKKASKVVAQPAKKKGGFGRFALITLGITALAGIGWAAFQALRADDDLWLDDIED